MKSLAIIALAMLAGCSTSNALVDTGPAPDGGVLGDARVIDDSAIDSGPTLADAAMLADTGADADLPDAWTDVDAGALDDAAVTDDAASADDAAIATDASVTCHPTWTDFAGTSTDGHCLYRFASPMAGVRGLSWSTLAERDDYLATLGTLVTSSRPSVSGMIAIERLPVSASCTSGGGSAPCRAVVPESQCVTIGATSRCMAWYWTSGPAMGTPVAGMPTPSGAYPAMSTGIFLTLRATGATSTGTVTAIAPEFAISP